MGKNAELAALRSEVAALREELRLAREVPWWQQQGSGVTPGCACGTTARCPVHPAPWQGGYGFQNMCGGAAGYPPSIVLNTACADQMPYDAARMTAGAGCALPQVLTLNG